MCLTLAINTITYINWGPTQLDQETERVVRYIKKLQLISMIGYRNERAYPSSIDLYKHRMLQIRMSIFNSLLLVGYYIAFFAFYFALKNDENLFRIGWALCLPLVSIILNILAIRSIGRDEVMVKAADRLR